MQSLIRAAIFALSSALPLAAQVPDGWGIASAWRQLNYTTGGGGLIVFHPHQIVAPWSVTGLPSDLTGVGLNPPNNLYGAHAVLIRPSDGRVLVGERTSIPTETVEIHEITISGQAAVADVRHPIGTPDPILAIAQVNQMAWLPDGRVLFTHFGVLGPALGNSNLAILDLTTGAVTAVPVTGINPPARLNSVAVDASGTTAYVGANELNVSPTNLRVYAIPVPAGGQATFLGSLPGNSGADMIVDNNGDLLMIARTSGSQGGLFRFSGSQFFPVNPTLQLIKGALTIDRVTGEYVARVDAGAIQNIERITSIGARTIVRTLPQGSAVLSGMDILPSMRPYGTQMSGNYRFAVAPNPGGAPTLGNGAFSLTANATAGPLPGLMLVGFQPASQQVLGVQLLVGSIALAMSFPAAATYTLPLAVPNDPALAGGRLFAQAIHINGTQLLSSEGLQFTLF